MPLTLHKKYATFEGHPKSFLFRYKATKTKENEMVNE